MDFGIWSLRLYTSYMRTLSYIAILAVGFVFFLNRYENIARNEITENIPQGVVIDPNALVYNSQPETNQPGKTQDAQGESADAKKIEEQNKVDQKTLKLIRENISKAEEAIKEIEKKNEVAQQQKPAPKIRLSQEELYGKAETRVVNFFCSRPGGIKVASGVIISQKGYILTNAHVAEGFDKDYECMIRQGSPARSLGYAKLVMFPSSYASAKTRQEQAENDISIWLMSKGAGENPLPETFPYYEIDPFYFPESNQPLATFSYPSELLGYETLLKSLNMMFAETIVSEFDANFILSTSGLSSQIGSSGGVLVDVYTNRFAGIIFGVSKDESISQRSLFSLTPNSVERVLKNETGQTLAEFLSK